MTIDEAIENLNGMYEYTRHLYDSNAEYENVLCERYKQLVEWLEELKWYKSQFTYTEEVVKEMTQQSYDKALDDVTEKYFDAIENILHEKDLCLTLNQALSIYARIMDSCNRIKIAEQLRK